MATDYFAQLALTRNPYLVKSLLKQNELAKSADDWNLLIGQNDKGVELNRGRIGSRDAGRVLLHHFSMMMKPAESNFSICSNFIPVNQSEIPKNLWNKNSVHLGSGHDHAYDFLQLALANGAKNFIILNFDAHADMRKDNLLHSGTPFRFFYEQNKTKIKNYTLHQYGLNPYSQNPADLELSGANVKVLWQQDMSFEKIKETLNTLKTAQKEDTLLLVSLDADVISGNSMSAVSAVNPRGVSPELIFQTLKYIKEEFKMYQPKLGIYEYNPLYDEISGRGAKLLATILYDWIFPCHSNNS